MDFSVFFPWREIGLIVISGVLQALMNPFFWIILVFVWRQYRQMQKTQINMFGICSYKMTTQMLLAVVYGLAGGLFASALLTLTGVTINQMGLLYIWPMVLALALINIRYLCFAYAGGIVAFINALTGWPDVNGPQILALVALLHITESILIRVSGNYSTIPICLKHSEGRVVGAFNLQNYWPLPLAVLIAAPVSLESYLTMEGGVNMPDWWPIFPIGAALGPEETWVYSLLPVVAALGYGDIAISSLPEKRRRNTAGNLAVYSLILLALAITVVHYQYFWLKAFAALFAIVGHEALIRIFGNREMRSPPRFVQPPEGVMVLYALRDLPAGDFLKPGDIVRSIDKWPVNNLYDLDMSLRFAPEIFAVEFERGGSLISCQTKFKNGSRLLGIIPAPQPDAPSYVEVSQTYGILTWLKNKIFKKG